MPIFPIQGMGFQSYNPVSSNAGTNAWYNSPASVVSGTANTVGLANYYNTPVQTGYNSPILNFLTNTARVVKPYLSNKNDTQPYPQFLGVRG